MIILFSNHILYSRWITQIIIGWQHAGQQKIERSSRCCQPSEYMIQMIGTPLLKRLLNIFFCNCCQKDTTITALITFNTIQFSGYFSGAMQCIDCHFSFIFNTAAFVLRTIYAIMRYSHIVTSVCCVLNRLQRCSKNTFYLTAAWIDIPKLYWIWRIWR